MSVDVSVTAPGCCAGHGFQFTYNYSEALRAAGLPSWQMMSDLPAQIVGILIGRGLLELKSDRDRYEPLIKGGGAWGTWNAMLAQLTELLAACDKHATDGMVRCG